MRTPDNLISLVLESRGLFTDAERTRYLNPSYNDIRHSWKSFPDMEKAIARIFESISNNETICVYGDFDVDGLTATAILHKTLKQLNANVFYYIPDRTIHGHSLNREAILEISNQADLIITVDCGIGDIQEVEYARHLGLDVIITDHHPNESSRLPNAHSIIIPPEFLETDFSGAGIAFKLCQGLLANENDSLVMKLMALTALGTITDCVEQNNENRVICSIGLRELSTLNSPGLKKIIENADISLPVTEYDVSWKIAPRLNSASRMGAVDIASATLITENVYTSEKSADSLEILNDSRKKIIDKLYKIMEVKIDDRYPSIILVFNKEEKEEIKNKIDYNISPTRLCKGMQGLLAAKICGNYSKPTIIFTDMGEGYLEGSARSIPGYDVSEMVGRSRDLLVFGGGHPGAGGMSLYIENLEKLKKRIYDYTRNAPDTSTKFNPRQVQKPNFLELGEVCLELYHKIMELEPFGQYGIPLWRTFCKLEGEPRVIGKNQNHLSFNVTDGENVFRCLAWNMANRIDELKQSEDFNLVLDHRLTMNSWKNNISVELHVQNFHISDEKENNEV